MIFFRAFRGLRKAEPVGTRVAFDFIFGEKSEVGEKIENDRLLRGRRRQMEVGCGVNLSPCRTKALALTGFESKTRVEGCLGRRMRS